MRNIATMMQKAKEMQEGFSRIKDELEAMRFIGESGGGSVEVETDGRGYLHSVKLNPAVMGGTDADDKAMLEDLIIVAVNDAKQKAETARSEQIKKLTGGLPLPPGLDLPF